MFAVLKKHRSLSYKMKAERQKRRKRNVQGATTAKEDGGVNRSTGRISTLLCNKSAVFFFVLSDASQFPFLIVIFPNVLHEKQDPKLSAAFAQRTSVARLDKFHRHLPSPHFFWVPLHTCHLREVGKRKEKRITRQVAS